MIIINVVVFYIPFFFQFSACLGSEIGTLQFCLICFFLCSGTLLHPDVDPRSLRGLLALELMLSVGQSVEPCLFARLQSVCHEPFECRHSVGELGEVFHELTVVMLVPVLLNGNQLVQVRVLMVLVSLAASFWHSSSRFDMNAETLARLT